MEICDIRSRPVPRHGSDLLTFTFCTFLHSRRKLKIYSNLLL